MKAPLFTKILIPLFLFGSFTFNGCKKDESESSELKTLSANYQKWKSKEIVSYRMEETCIFDVGGVHDLLVINGSISSVQTKQGLPVSLTSSSVKTIDQLFAFIESSLNRKYATAKIMYDPIYGYPTYVYFDYETQVIDEEQGYSIKDFNPVVE